MKMADTRDILAINERAGIAGRLPAHAARGALHAFCRYHWLHQHGSAAQRGAAASGNSIVSPSSPAAGGLARLAARSDRHGCKWTEATGTRQRGCNSGSRMRKVRSEDHDLCLRILGMRDSNRKINKSGDAAPPQTAGESGRPAAHTSLLICAQVLYPCAIDMRCSETHSLRDCCKQLD